MIKKISDNENEIKYKCIIHNKPRTVNNINRLFRIWKECNNSTTRKILLY